MVTATVKRNTVEWIVKLGRQPGNNLPVVTATVRQKTIEWIVKLGL